MWQTIVCCSVFVAHQWILVKAAKCEIDETFDHRAQDGSECDCRAGFTGQACNIPLPQTTRSRPSTTMDLTSPHMYLTSPPIANSTGRKRKRPNPRQRRKNTTASGTTTGLTTHLVDDPCVPNPCLYGGSCTPNLRPRYVFSPKYKCKCPFGHNPEEECIHCDRGSFGQNCLQYCGRCVTRNGCSPYTGCSECAKGWYPLPTCHKVKCAQAENDTCYPGRCDKKHKKCVCPLFRTGFDCRDTQMAERCQRQTIPCRGGTCFIDNEGKEACSCPDGEMPDVEGTCIRTCKERSVSCRYGKCEGIHCKCEPGWDGLSCLERCDYLTYGQNCRHKCGFCKVHQCDKATGSCLPEGCIPGFLPENCHDLDPDEEVDEALYAYFSAFCEGYYDDDYENPSSAAYQQASGYMGAVAAEGAAALGSNADVHFMSFSRGSIQVRTVLKFRNFSHLENVDIKKELPKAIRKVYKRVTPPDGLVLKPESVTVLSVRRPPKGSSTSSEFTEDVKYFAIAVILTAAIAILISVTYLWRRRMKNRRAQMRHSWTHPRKIRFAERINRKRSQMYSESKLQNFQ